MSPFLPPFNRNCPCILPSRYQLTPRKSLSRSFSNACRLFCAPERVILLLFNALPPLLAKKGGYFGPHGQTASSRTNSFRINTYTSVHSKQLTTILNLLNATLTKNQGGGPIAVALASLPARFVVAAKNTGYTHPGPGSHPPTCSLARFSWYLVGVKSLLAGGAL